MVLVNLLLIQFIIVNLIDISGFIAELEGMLAKWLNIKSARIPKPFSCSYCSTWWVGLLYLLFTGNLTLYYVAFLLLLCSLTVITKEIIYAVYDILLKVIKTVCKLLL